jgi:hypothetical protein
MGLELFLRFPREKPSLTRETEREREREREVRPERSTIARLWWWGGSPGEQTPSECQMVMVTFLGSLSQFGTIYTDLR